MHTNSTNSKFTLKHLFLLLIVSLTFFSCDKDIIEDEPPVIKEILTELNKIDEFSVTEITPENGGTRQFEIFVKQPIDHNNIAIGTFYQMMYLTFEGFEDPVVFNPSGYGVRAQTKSEVSNILNANDIHIGHRYFNGSKPDNIDWQYMTIEQSAADHHRIIEFLKPIFEGKWLSSGGSKGGVTALFHRKFYPDDVTVTIALASPISRELDDPRYVPYIQNLGTEEERTILENYAIGLLTRRNDLIPLIDSYVNTLPDTFTLTASQMLEVEALEFTHAYWQYYGGIGPEEIPDLDSSIDEYFNFIKPAIPYMSAPRMDYFSPLYYQVYTQMGIYIPKHEHFAHLLIDFPEPDFRFKAPQGVNMTFDPTCVDEIVYWLENEGNNIIYIYGSYDPWTAGQIGDISATNSVKIIAEGFNHILRINEIPQKQIVYDALENWLEIEIN